MPQRNQHSLSADETQVICSPEQDWNDLVEQRLPADLETQAQALGAFQRARGGSSARVLLRAVLCYVLSLSSLKELSGWSRLVGVSTHLLASQSWHKWDLQAIPGACTVATIYSQDAWLGST
jgi:hypothetical protein